MSIQVIYNRVIVLSILFFMPFDLVHPSKTVWIIRSWILFNYLLGLVPQLEIAASKLPVYVWNVPGGSSVEFSNKAADL